MPTSTIGSNPSCNDWLWDGSNNQASIGTYAITDAVGRMITVTAQFGRFGSNATGGACGWKGTGSSANPYTAQTINQGNTGAGTCGATNTAVYSSSGDVPFASSDNWYFGFYCAGGVFTAHHQDSGNSYTGNNGTGTVSQINNYSIYSSSPPSQGSQIAYGTYFIIETYVRTTVWNKTITYVDTAAGNNWSAGDVSVRVGAGWTQVGELVRRGELWYERERMGRYPDGTPVLLRWAYDEPRYLGHGYPGDPCLKCREAELLAA